jgi:prepilin-type N-terminal cleavage/methylation domain-containing protein
MTSRLKKKYQGYSLVEMLITIVIIGAVMLIASVTLTTLIKVSTVSSNKTKARTDSEFILELVRRTVRNSNPSDVYIYDSSSVRKYDPEDNIVVSELGANLSVTYGTALTSGNEIHFRPYGYESWVCIAFFTSTLDPEMGYIVKTTVADLTGQHQNCFTQEYTGYVIPLNSDAVDIDSFQIAYTELDDLNYMIRFDIDVQPTEWYLGLGAPVRKEIHRQAVVSTEGIMW